MSKTQRFFDLTIIIVVVCITALFVVSATAQEQSNSFGGDNVKTLLFMEANMAKKAAEKAHADILAPKNFGKAMNRYIKAENELLNSKDLKDIRQNLSEACNFFQKAIDATKLAEITFPNLLKARADAQDTGALIFSSDLWTEAEWKFDDAAGELEDGDINNAREEAADAENLYRQAELDAIKANYLDETRELLKQAEQMDVEDRAPKTFQLSQQLVNQAERELNENRYDNDVARSLAKQANYQAKYAIYLSKAIKQMKDQDQSWEDLMLASEKPLMQIDELTGHAAKFDAGWAKTTNKISAYIITYQDSVDKLIQVVNWYDQTSRLMEARISELEQKFGSQEKEKSALALQIAQQAETREIFTKVERSFLPNETSVFREGDDIIIRLVGLNFPSGQSTIEQKSFGLLTKVRDAINYFPGSTISVQGHTDSYGGDVQNLQLSKDRAEAVKQYLKANSNLVISQIDVLGYGESKPIASNETINGRAANRRVEVVIHPLTERGAILDTFSQNNEDVWR